MTRLGRRQGLAYTAAVLTVLLLLVGAAPASAATIGQVRPGTFPVGCSGSFDGLQKAISSGNPYTVPSTAGVTTWTVTSWSTTASAPPGDIMTLKFFRKVGDPDHYMAIAHDGPRTISEDGSLRTFQTNLQVKAGDILGLHWSVDGNCAFDGTFNDLIRTGEFDLADGASATFPDQDEPYRLDVSAEITPTSSFTLGKVKARPNGTATLQANLPNPGDLTVSGKGVKRSTSAVTAKRVNGGKVKAVIRAKGKNKRKLAENGKVTVKPKITFTPTGGTASTETKKVKLRRK